jgi:hypothetical protein
MGALRPGGLYRVGVEVEVRREFAEQRRRLGPESPLICVHGIHERPERVGAVPGERLAGGTCCLCGVCPRHDEIAVLVPDSSVLDVLGLEFRKPVLRVVPTVRTAHVLVHLEGHSRLRVTPDRH